MLANSITIKTISLVAISILISLSVLIKDALTEAKKHDKLCACGLSESILNVNAQNTSNHWTAMPCNYQWSYFADKPKLAPTAFENSSLTIALQ